jgi:hypothetical protein
VHQKEKMLHLREKVNLIFKLIITVFILNANGCTINLETTTTILSTTSATNISYSPSITTATKSTSATHFIINDAYCGFVN